MFIHTLCFSHIIYLNNKKFDWLFKVDPIWLVWHTYISHSLTHSAIDPSITYPTRRLRGIFFYKKITQLQRPEGRQGQAHFLGASSPDSFPPDRFALRRSRVWFKSELARRLCDMWPSTAADFPYNNLHPSTSWLSTRTSSPVRFLSKLFVIVFIMLFSWDYGICV